MENVRMEFERDDLFLVVDIPAEVGDAGVRLLSFGVLFPAEVHHRGGLFKGAMGDTTSLDENRIVLVVYESDQKTIRANLDEDSIDLFASHRLIDTRHGLVMYVYWTFAKGRPQAVSAGQFINMQSEPMVALAREFGGQEKFLVAYCDINTRKIVRVLGFPGQMNGIMPVLADLADHVVAAGDVYTQEVNFQRAIVEARAYLDIAPGLAIQPERTYASAL